MRAIHGCKAPTIIVTNNSTLNKLLLMEPVVSLLSKIIYNIVNNRFPLPIQNFYLTLYSFPCKFDNPIMSEYDYKFRRISSFTLRINRRHKHMAKHLLSQLNRINGLISASWQRTVHHRSL